MTRLECIPLVSLAFPKIKTITITVTFTWFSIRDAVLPVLMTNYHE